MKSSKQFCKVFLFCATHPALPSSLRAGRDVALIHSLQSPQMLFAHHTALGLHSDFSLTALSRSSALSQPL